MGGIRGTFTIQDILEGKAEENWRRKGVPEEDIEFSRVSGMDAGDIRGFRKFTARHPGYLIVVRCPKLTSRPHHGIFPPKPGYATKDRDGKPVKSGTSGLVVYKGQKELPDGTKVPRDKLFVSDYDLMSFWRRGPKGFEKVTVSPADGKKRGAFSPEATGLIRELNGCMESRSRIAHGCQDDWNSTENRGIQAGDRFAAFDVGTAELFVEPSGLNHCYEKFHLPACPYENTGKYNPSKPA